MEQEKPKRKTKTSKEAVRRYKQKAVKSISFELPIKLVEEFKAKCKENGDAQARIVRNAIEKYLSE